ncbi:MULTISPECIES: HIT family protein [unclassified Deinococcus]|uniref:HIT family protein n=1 Tax=unclassified Deinococcus TaxID=2623546 RepID=UPI000992C5A3|nr:MULTISPECIES: HIT domain-containing protein [unclassified Deinococcus]MCD0168326.1 HIT domain-containing protein [Deinococcus sp. 23YEL01]OOV14402.1 hypothetical protein BXU09_06695 [Deinococcus sp. LM3]
MSGCIFCRIVAGDAPASMVAGNELAVAFLDIGAFTRGHTLVVPRRHAVTFTDLTPEEAAAMTALAQEVARAIQSSEVRGEGFNLWMANGAAAGQDVFHAHLHVFPRHAKDGVSVAVDALSPTRAELDEVAAGLRRVLESA